MKITKKLLATLLTVILLFTSVPFSFANAGSSSSIPGVTITASACKSKYSWGDDIYFDVNVKNNTDDVLRNLKVTSTPKNISYFYGAEDPSSAIISVLNPGEAKTVKVAWRSERQSFLVQLFVLPFQAIMDLFFNMGGFDETCRARVGLFKYKFGFDVDFSEEIEQSTNLKIDKKIFVVGDKDNTTKVTYSVTEDIESVELLLEDQVLYELYDNGDIYNGDDIPEDGVYSTVIYVDTSNENEFNYEVKIIYSNGNIEKESFCIEVYSLISKEEAEDFVSIYDDGTLNQLLNSLEGAISDTDKNKAKDAIINYFETLESSKIVSDVTVSSDKSVIYFEAFGIKGAYLLEKLDKETFEGVGYSTATYTPVSTYSANTYSQAYNENVIGNNDALILSSFPSNASSVYVGAYQNLFSKLNGFNKYNFDATLKYNATVDDYKNMIDDYGMLFINSHGMLYDNKYPVICLEEECSVGKVIEYSYELWHGLLVSYGGLGLIGASFAITPSYISFYHENTLPNSLVYMCICHGVETDDMANAFRSAGAATVTGYSDSVLCDYDRNILDEYVDSLLEGNTTSEAFNDAIDLHGSNDGGSPAFFRIRGDADLTIINTGIINPSFEETDLYGWSTGGDVRSINKLGTLSVLDGKQMAIISTGLGSVNDSNSYIKQTFIVPDDATKIKINYNFVSEEPMEYVNSSFDDKFEISITNSEGQGNTYIVETINTSVWNHLGGDYFSEGDGTTYHTGWKIKDIDVSAYRGQSITLKLRVYDVGDSAYDSAALIDNIELE